MRCAGSAPAGTATVGAVTARVDIDAARARAAAVVDELAADLVDVARRIHARPELAYEERFAAGLLAGTIAARGLAVERGAYGLETCFVARAGSHAGRPHVVVCCEYDALPDIGHGCGHNVIGAAGVGAGLALAAVAGDVGGRVTILGTPAEEGGGGKIRLLDAGAFDDADVAMMIHPAEADVAWAPHIAATSVTVEMHGRAAHAAAGPWHGVNALDALVLGYQAVANLRQHLRSSEKVHGIITHGGEAPNIVPDHAAGVFRVRAAKEKYLAALQERVLACFRGAAEQTGCRLEYEWDPVYADLVSNRTLARRYQANGEALGRRFFPDPDRIPLSVAGSTDFGNVSKRVPAIHPMIAMTPVGVAGHSVEFAECAASPAADRAVVDGAKAMAMTGVELWCDPDLYPAVRAEWEAAVAGG